MATNGSSYKITTNELVPLLDEDPNLYLLDVRETDEVAEWSIQGVHNIPLGDLDRRYQEIPQEQNIVVICAKGARALQGSQILADHGVNSKVLEGGMGAWASTYDSVEAQFGGATVVQLRRRGKGCLSYIIGAGGNSVVIDPSLNTEEYEQIASEHGWIIRNVLDTHLHADHISGARQLADKTDSILMLSPSDPFTFAFTPLTDGLEIEIAEGISLGVSAVSVPGHTEGSTMYQLGTSAIFTGDTLFLESVGRPDLAEQAEAFAHNLYESLHQRILPLNDEIMVFPAHYGQGVEVHKGVFVSKELGKLRTTLPALALSEADFIAWAIKNVKDRPPNYQQIVLINTGQREIQADSEEMELGPNRCAIA